MSEMQQAQLVSEPVKRDHHGYGLQAKGKEAQTGSEQRHGTHPKSIQSWHPIWGRVQSPTVPDAVRNDAPPERQAANTRDWLTVRLSVQHNTPRLNFVAFSSQEPKDNRTQMQAISATIQTEDKVVSPSAGPWMEWKTQKSRQPPSGNWYWCMEQGHLSRSSWQVSHTSPLY